MTQPVKWAVLDQDGSLTRGEGPARGLVNRLEEGQAAAFLFPGLPPIYAAGPIDLLWTVERVVGVARPKRWWSLATGEHGRTWVWPDGSMIGLGDSVEKVEEAHRLLHQELS